MSPRMKAYVKAGRKNFWSNNWFDRTHGNWKRRLGFLWFVVKEPFIIFARWVHRVLGSFIDRQGVRCEACNDTGYMFAWPEFPSDEDPYCECVVGVAMKAHCGTKDDKE